ncbi:acylphosphatase [Sutcliffiella horikoshii]|uniref:acylphosphatase n=1 Tax=Sutcliffiella horikoshii TaxID=79883 RepID=UPI00384CA997
MNELQDGWLTHLPFEVVKEALGWELDAYVIALEGWRRGLTLTWHAKDSEKFSVMNTWSVDKPGKLFSLSSKKRKHYFFRTRGDKVTNEAVRIGSDKQLTKQYLERSGVNVPKGILIKGYTIDQNVIEQTNSLGYPLVMKPLDGSYGKGVITNIRNKKELLKAFEYIRYKLGYQDIIIEKYIKGSDYRLYVVGEEVIAAIQRLPANIIGDGQHNILELIENKNNKRSLNPRLASCLINPDQDMENFLLKSGMNMEFIPAEGDTIFLNDKCNISIGGDSEDVFDNISSSIKDLAVQAIKAVPGLAHGAVDIMVENEGTDLEKAYIIELNPTSQIGSLIYPLKGRARDVPSSIIDYYFPETVSSSRHGDAYNFYFPYKELLEPLSTFMASTVKVRPFPSGHIVKRILLNGKVNETKLSGEIHKYFKQKDISGLIYKFNNSNVEIVIAGQAEEIKTLIEKLVLKQEIKLITEEDYSRPVKIGNEHYETNKTYLKRGQTKYTELPLDIAIEGWKYGFNLQVLIKRSPEMVFPSNIVFTLSSTKGDSEEVIYINKNTTGNIKQLLADKGSPAAISGLTLSLERILPLLENGLADSIMLTPVSAGLYKSKKFTLSGKVNKNSFHQLIKKEAISKQIHGYIEILPNKNIDIVVAGISNKNLTDFEEAILSAKGNFTITKTTKQNWKEPVEAGFHIFKVNSNNDNKSFSTLRNLVKKALITVQKSLMKQ